MTSVSTKVISALPRMPSGCFLRRHVRTKLPQNVSQGLNIHEHAGVMIMEIIQRSEALWVQR